MSSPPVRPLITRALLLAHSVCAPGLAAWDAIGPDHTLDPNDKAAVIAALRAGLAPHWRWAHGRGLLSCNLTGADLAGADLTNANLTRADLTNADLTRAKMPKGEDQ